MFADKLSGKNADRSELVACLDYLRPGDILVVPGLDRPSRSLADLITIVGTLRAVTLAYRDQPTRTRPQASHIESVHAVSGVKAW